MSQENRYILLRLGLTVILFSLAFILPLAASGKIVLWFIAYLLSGYDVLWRALQNFLRGKICDENFLMTLATAGAFAMTEFPEAVGVMFFYQIGEHLQDAAVDKSRKSISALLALRPDTVSVLRNGQTHLLSPQEVAPGEIILVKPGERIPLDGEIVSGQTMLDTSALTGESLPVEKFPGDSVYSGTLNLNSILIIRANSSYAESTSAKILELMETAASQKAPAEKFITKFSRYYTPCVILGACLLIIIPPVLLQQPWSDWINRALIFLMVSCPCALVISIPLSFFTAIGAASQQGILIKGSNYIEALASLDTLFFDKTGTLTKGSFSVDAVHPQNISAAQLMDIAAAAESGSTHPIAMSILAAHQKHLDKNLISNLTELPGKGLKAEIGQKTYYIGNSQLMAEIQADWHPCHLDGLTIHIAEKCRYLGHIIVKDEIKPDAASAIAALKKLGIQQTIMLTGDKAETAQSIQVAAGLDSYKAELLPAQKLTELEAFLSQGRRTAFIGDGINDAPVLARADVGIAMGALGCDAAIEAADIIIMDDELEKIPAAIRLARKTMYIVKENIFFALLSKGIILILAALGIAGIWLAVFSDVGVMLLAILNALRLMQKQQTAA